MAFDIEKYNALIIEPDIDARMRLKQATASVVQFKTVGQCTTIDEAVNRLGNSSEIWDVLFVSHRFHEDVVRGFVQQRKTFTSSQDSACVLLVKGSDAQATTSQILIVGADGALFEPYSVEQLLEITRLAARIKLESQEARERVAVTLLIRDVISQLDKVAVGIALSVDMSVASKKFKSMCARLRTMPPSMLNQYITTIIPALMDAPLPSLDPGIKNYGGASSRIKKIMDKRIKEKLVAEQENEAKNE